MTPANAGEHLEPPAAGREARRDPALTAVVVECAPLRYAEGEDTAADRPAHVRAGSSLGRIGGEIALIQDDANFVALFDPAARRTRAIALPAGAAGLRQFDDRRGNKRHKLDLEACVVVTGAAAERGPVLVALGSGSTARREYVALVDGWAEEPPRVELVRAPQLYEALRREAGFSGAELNVEGALQLGRRLRLFGRGNGAPRDGARPLNATCDLDLDALLAHLRAPDRVAPPTPTDVVQYDLGALDGVPLGFTDAAAWGDAILFTAAAEESPDVTRDGRVTGSIVGVLDAGGVGGVARWAPLTGTSGEWLATKVEGILAPEGADGRAIVVTDVDDPGAPSELCTVELRGPWRRGSA